MVSFIKLKIAVFVCSNGLGHLRRQSKIINLLLDKNIKVDLYANLESVKKYDRNLVKITTNLNLKDKIFNYNLSYNLDILSNINFKQYDLILSDNLVELTFFHNKVFLFSSFYWSRQLELNENDNNTFSNLEKKIKIHYSTGFFTPKYISSQKSFVDVGFFGTKNPINKNFHKKNVLVSCGNDVNDTKSYIENNLDDMCNKLCDYQIYTDVTKNNKTRNLHDFRYKESDFKKIDIAIIRPGMGIITELLSREIPIVVLSVENTPEMLFNKDQLVAMGCIAISKIDELNNDLLDSHNPYIENINFNAENFITEKIIRDFF